MKYTLHNNLSPPKKKRENGHSRSPQITPNKQRFRAASGEEIVLKRRICANPSIRAPIARRMRLQTGAKRRRVRARPGERLLREECGFKRARSAGRVRARPGNVPCTKIISPPKKKRENGHSRSPKITPNKQRFRAASGEEIVLKRRICANPSIRAPIARRMRLQTGAKRRTGPGMARRSAGGPGTARPGLEAQIFVDQ